MVLHIMEFIFTDSVFIYNLKFSDDIAYIKRVKPSELHYVYTNEYKLYGMIDGMFIPSAIDCKIYFRGLVIDLLKNDVYKGNKPYISYSPDLKSDPREIIKDIQEKYYITETPFIKFTIYDMDGKLVKKIEFKSDHYMVYEQVMLCGDYAIIKGQQFLSGVDYINEVYKCIGFIFGFDVIKLEC